MTDPVEVLARALSRLDEADWANATANDWPLVAYNRAQSRALIAQITPAFVAEAVQEAVQAEREACADYADRHRSQVQVNEPLWHEGQDWACDRIAAAIRARTP